MDRNIQQPPAGSSPQRVQFVDLLRGWAVIVMIETHCVNGMLRPELRTTDVYSVLTYINGLVAPTFLFASGLAYALTTHRKLAEYLSFGRPLFKQLGRLLLILACGYLLHIPRFEYYHLRYEAGAEAWKEFFQADILHCIAVSLLLLQLLLLVLRSERRMYWAVALFTIGILAATPVLWSIDFWQFLPPVTAAYLNGLHYSLFPLFPWTAFLFSGALVGHFYVAARGRGDETSVGTMMRAAAGTGIALIILSFVLEKFELLVYSSVNYWLTGPSFVLLRIGIVLLLLYGMFLYESRRGVRPASVVALVGRQSLVVYVVHLTALYGKVGSRSLVNVVGASFGPLEVLVTALVLLGAMIAIALAWDQIKKKSPRLKRAVQAVVAGALVLVFFVRI